MNRINIKSIFVAAAITSVTFTSCDGYLDTFPSDSLVSTDAITTLQDVETALNGAYYELKDDSYYGCDFVARAEVGGEDVQTLTSGGLRTDTYYRFTHRQNNSPEELWSYPYAIINRANVLLNAIETGDLPAGDELNNAKGEALALRALCHFDLLITYAKPYFVENGETPGIVLVKEVLGADDLPARSTVAQGYEMVITDLEEALKYIGTEVKNGRFNSWAVKGLLARINLYKRDWEKAFSYAEDVINNSPYSLLKTEDYVASWSARYSSESVFDLEISDLDAGNREMFGYVVDPKGYAAISITKEFEDLINENQDDIRRNLLSATAIEGRTYMNKYPGIGGKAAVNNIRVIRLSDIYLIAAEAALKKSSVDQASANKYLNAIIKRAIPGAADVTATEALVLKERRKELVMEGHRFYDIMRLGITVTRQGGYHFLNNTDLISPSYQDYRTILAIPQAEIDVNPNIKQNEGYF
ncbi:RagB/SusD family nutrient uptake outer membrane protein [uncultured Parabacteroides sp.]|uniref:RagB/SusD family nutrient uptake outer membrane protein n=1 Tax=uncultured Parabacteroides sp. TaxID=512312 RepID=UPI0025D08967|nr:RagB/SusD family nutrient uptake outer membrane protein [uncultured Parabacteroides sp.]